MAEMMLVALGSVVLFSSILLISHLTQRRSPRRMLRWVCSAGLTLTGAVSVSSRLATSDPFTPLSSYVIPLMLLFAGGWLLLGLHKAERLIWREVSVKQGYISAVDEASNGYRLLITYHHAQVVTLSSSGVSSSELRDNSVTFPLPVSSPEARSALRATFTDMMLAASPVTLVMRFETRGQNSKLRSARLHTQDLSIDIGSLDDVPPTSGRT